MFPLLQETCDAACQYLGASLCNGLSENTVACLEFWEMSSRPEALKLKFALNACFVTLSGTSRTASAGTFLESNSNTGLLDGLVLPGRFQTSPPMHMRIREHRV